MEIELEAVGMELCFVPQLSLCFLHVIRRGTLTVDIYCDSAKRREAVQPQAAAATVPILV